MPAHRTPSIRKTCPICGESFQTCAPGRTSRYLKPAEQVYCSGKCSDKARFHAGTSCNTLSAVDAAYIAGFVDGEGSIVLYGKRDTVYLRVAISQGKPEVLHWMLDVIGAGSIFGKPIRNPKHGPAYLLSLNSDAAASLLRQIRPYLRVKKVQADLAIAFQERLHDPILKSDPTWRQISRAQMQHLNMRGPA